MTDDPTRDSQPPVEFDLEPLPDVVVDPNRGYQPGYYPGISQRGDNGLPIPQREGHLCPKCKYDVRGLTGRICPECGQHFTIAESRQAGLANSPDVRRDFNAILQQQWQVYGSIIVFALSIFSPFIVTPEPLTLGGFGMQLMFALPFGLMGAMFCYNLMRPMKDGIVFAVALHAVFSLVLLLI